MVQQGNGAFKITPMLKQQLYVQDEHLPFLLFACMFLAVKSMNTHAMELPDLLSIDRLRWNLQAAVRPMLEEIQ